MRIKLTFKSTSSRIPIIFSESNERIKIKFHDIRYITDHAYVVEDELRFRCSTIGDTLIIK